MFEGDVDEIHGLGCCLTTHHISVEVESDDPKERAEWEQSDLADLARGRQDGTKVAGLAGSFWTVGAWKGEQVMGRENRHGRE